VRKTQRGFTNLILLYIVAFGSTIVFMVQAWQRDHPKKQETQQQQEAK